MAARSSLRIAISPCPNDIFIFGALIERRLDWKGPELIFEYHDIEELNRLGVSDDPPDVLKFSFAHLPKLSKDYRLLEAGSALGKGVGPLLVGQAGVELEDRKEILIPGEQTTAALLCRHFVPAFIPRRVVRYDCIMDELKRDSNLAGVIIHESRFTYEDHGLSCLIDLGKQWENKHHLPLPLGGIAIKKSIDFETRKALTQAIRDSLHNARADRESLRKLMRFHAREMNDEVMDQHIELYVNDYSMALGLEGRRAIENLLGESSSFGLLSESGIDETVQ